MDYPYEIRLYLEIEIFAVDIVLRQGEFCGRQAVEEVFPGLEIRMAQREGRMCEIGSQGICRSIQSG